MANTSTKMMINAKIDKVRIWKTNPIIITKKELEKEFGKKLYKRMFK